MSTCSFGRKIAGETVVIETHHQPHFDEILAIWLAEKFGNVGFVSKHCPSNILLLGEGGGNFDEHPFDGGPRKEGDCCATLVAKALGVDDDPALEKILKFGLNTDLGKGQPFDLASMVKLLHQAYPDDPFVAIDWVYQALDAKYAEQYALHGPTREAFELNALIKEMIGPHGPVRVAVIVSDDPNMSKFARAVSGGNADIVIQQQTIGNTQIFTNQRSGITLFDVAILINLAEQEAAGEVVVKDWKVLSAEGTIPGGRWHFFPKGQMMLNGSLTHKDVPSTALSIETITALVRRGVNPKAFEPTRSADCLAGVCTSTATDPCPWYRYGLHRCREIRYKAKATS